MTPLFETDELRVTRSAPGPRTNRYEFATSDRVLASAVQRPAAARRGLRQLLGMTRWSPDAEFDVADADGWPLLELRHSVVAATGFEVSVAGIDGAVLGWVTASGSDAPGIVLTDPDGARLGSATVAGTLSVHDSSGQRRAEVTWASGAPAGERGPVFALRFAGPADPRMRALSIGALIGWDLATRPK
ncbi:hypothetical protein [Nocardioides sp. GXZ039]|uniref:hypothetical protein n=1 Tax=Nocardioides sp. GXZ039 TaxID=3136018 RepID=UPI0030F471A0